MRLALLAVASALVLHPSAQADDYDRLCGTWVLVSWTASASDRAVLPYPMGKDALGQIIYSPDRYVLAQLARNPTSSADADPAVPASIAYGGRVEVSGTASEIRHHVEIASIPAWIGTTLVRAYRFEGERLTLSFVGAGGNSNTLEWKRASQGEKCK